MRKEELLKGLSEEQIEKVEACKGTDELLALAEEEGVELTAEQLKAVSGGACGNVKMCPACKGDNFCLAGNRLGSDTGKTLYYCRDCQMYFFYEKD